MHMTSSSLENFARVRRWTSFFLELRRLAWLVGGPLPERWLTGTFVSGLPQHIKHLLQASSRMETMSAEQLFTQARAVMIDNEGPAELAAATFSVKNAQ